MQSSIKNWFRIDAIFAGWIDSEEGKAMITADSEFIAIIDLVAYSITN